MSNARRDVARLGYEEIYVISTPRPTIEQVNAELGERGLEAIKTRTYRHFEKLDRYGQDHYTPINRFDVQTMRRPDTGTTPR